MLNFNVKIIGNWWNWEKENSDIVGGLWKKMGGLKWR